jgi:hypothetical protein
MESLAEAVLQGTVGEIVRIISELDTAGKDMPRLVLELLDYFRALLVYLCAPDVAGKDEDLVAAQMETLKRQAGLTTAERLLRIADILSQTEDRLRFALSRRTQVETALIRCARTTAVSIDDLMRRVEALAKGGVEIGAVKQEKPQAVPAARPAMVASEPVATYSVRAPAAPTPKAAPAVAAKPVVVMNELEMLTSQWNDIILKVGKIASLAKAMLIDSKPLDVSSDRVIIGFDPEFKQNMSRVAENQTYYRAIQGVLAQILKRSVTLEMKLISGEGRVDVPADHMVETAGTAKGKGVRSKQDWVKDPAVRHALELFNGGIVDIRE